MYLKQQKNINGNNGTNDTSEIHIVMFQPSHPSDVTRGQSSVYLLWVRVRVSSIHGEKHYNVGQPDTYITARKMGYTEYQTCNET